MVKRGLIIKEPYATWIVKGIKKWEIRKTKTNIRGRIYIVSKGYIIGSVELIDVLGPFSVEELTKYVSYHKASKESLEKYAKNKKLYAWVLDKPVEFKKPIKIQVPKGAQIWVRLNDLSTDQNISNKNTQKRKKNNS